MAKRGQRARFGTGELGMKEAVGGSRIADSSERCGALLLTAIRFFLAGGPLIATL